MDHYEFTTIEQQYIDQILGSIQQHGGLFKRDREGGLMLEDSQPFPLPFEVVYGKRYCVDPQGRIWRFAPKGSKKRPDMPHGGGPPRRLDVIEMWTGHWRKMLNPATGEPSYAKNLIWCSVTAGVNEHPNITHIDWYTTSKGFKHPYDPPHAPTKAQLGVLERKAAETDLIIFAKIGEEAKAEGWDPGKIQAVSGLSSQPPTPTPPPAKKPNRTNKRKKKPNAARP